MFAFALTFGIEVYLRDECVAFYEETPRFIDPLGSVIDVYSTGTLGLELCYSAVDDMKISIKKIDAVHCLFIDSQGLAYFTRTIRHILYLVAFYITI